MRWLASIVLCLITWLSHTPFPPTLSDLLFPILLTSLSNPFTASPFQTTPEASCPPTLFSYHQPPLPPPGPRSYLLWLLMLDGPPIPIATARSEAMCRYAPSQPGVVFNWYASYAWYGCYTCRRCPSSPTWNFDSLYFYPLARQ